MSEIATRIRPRSSRIGGALWLLFMVAMWVAFFAALVDGRLDDVWRWVTDLPLLVQLLVWLLAFPWLLGTAVWQSSWADWVRFCLVAAFATGWTLISIPRKDAER